MSFSQFTHKHTHTHTHTHIYIYERNSGLQVLGNDYLFRLKIYSYSDDEIIVIIGDILEQNASSRQ